MKLFKKLTGGVVTAILSAVIVVTVWFYYPGFVTDMMDVNLAAVKVAGAALPDHYGDQVEAALRILAGEKALLFFEAGLSIRLLLAALLMPFARRRKRAEEMAL